MPIDLLMPALSPTMTEGTLARWLKAENDPVQSGDILAEIETDKATMEIEAIDDGVLAKILIPAGTENVAVNAVIGILLEEDEDPAALVLPTPTETAALEAPPIIAATDVAAVEAKPAAPVAGSAAAKPTAVPAPVTPAPVAPKKSGDRVFASPLARRVASAKNLDLATLKGSGSHGRIILRDVENAQPQAATAPQASVSGTSAAVSIGGDINTPSTFTREPLSAMRKVIAQRLTESKQTIPHFYLSADCRIDAMLALRAQMNEGAEKHEKISVNDLVLKACALALIRQPKANACFDGDAVQYFDHADIAVAVSIPDGLITPVVRRADQRSLSQISSAVKDLAGRAREGKLTPEEYQGGSFTLSNLGMFGVDQFQAVINPPHACILAVGRGRKTPIMTDDDSIEAATVMNITLSVDHRAVDGAMGALLLDEIKGLIEHPIKMLI